MMIIQSQTTQYRFGSEPINLIIQCMGLDVQTQEVDNISMIEELQKLLIIGKDNNKFKKYIKLSDYISDDVRLFYQYVKLSTLKGYEENHQLIQQCEIFQNLIANNQTKYFDDDFLVSLNDLLLIECLEMVNYFFPYLIYEKYQALYQYQARILSINVFQSYYFNLEFVIKNYAPNIGSLNQAIKKIIEQNRDTFHDFAQCQGILYRYKEKELQFADNCPVSLFPLYINYSIVEDLKQKTLIQQQIIANMGNNFEWYSEILGKIGKYDEFIRRMIQIQEKVEKCQTRCPYTLCIVRNDFMHHALLNQWMQVEYNCIAISFGFISDRVQKFHTLLFDSYYKKIKQTLGIKIKQDLNHDQMVEALNKGFMLYGNPEAIILIITAEFEGNIYDQRYIEKGLAKLGILSRRTTFVKLIGNLTLQDGILKAFGQEVALVYFRTGYTFDQYENDECWNIREMIELSKAIKCPSMNTQLVNFKKLQQILLDPNQITKFISEEDANIVKENYCKIWGFDNQDEHQQLIEMVRSNPHDYVLKPQREGGGNNFYDEQIVPELEKLTPEQRTDFIIMERIKPIPRIGFMMRRGNLDLQAVISEISVIGYFITEGQKIIVNEVGGYLVRTKRYLDNEGGVAAGYSVVDSFMINDN